MASTFSTLSSLRESSLCLVFVRLTAPYQRLTSLGILDDTAQLGWVGGIGPSFIQLRLR